MGIHISLVADTMDGPASQRVLNDAKARLRSGGWRPLETDRFLRGHTMLALSKQRMDEWHAGDSADSGRWNVFLDLYPVAELFRTSRSRCRIAGWRMVVVAATG